MAGFSVSAGTCGVGVIEAELDSPSSCRLQRDMVLWEVREEVWPRRGVVGKEKRVSAPFQETEDIPL